MSSYPPFNYSYHLLDTENRIHIYNHIITVNINKYIPSRSHIQQHCTSNQNEQTVADYTVRSIHIWTQFSPFWLCTPPQQT